MPVDGSDELFPVHRIYCIGRNYAEHAREMGSDPDREAPFWFMKPADAVVLPGSAVPYPPRTTDLHHEVELVVALQGAGRNVSPAEVQALVFGYAVGIDLTRRDLQAEAKRTGRPWTTGKAFDHSAPMSAIRRAAAAGHPRRGTIELFVNGERRQAADLADMIWGVDEAIADLSTLFELKPGDLVFTGTPAGVGSLHPGDRLVGRIENVGELEVSIAG